MGQRARACEGYDRLVASINVAVQHTGDVLETTLGTLVVPANSMGVKGFVRIFTSFYGEGKGGQFDFKIYFGGVQIKSCSCAGNAVLDDIVPAYVWSRNHANFQATGIDLGTTHTTTTEARNRFAVNTAADVDIDFTGQVSQAAHSAYLRFASLEVFRFDA